MYGTCVYSALRRLPAMPVSITLGGPTMPGGRKLTTVSAAVLHKCPGWLYIGEIDLDSPGPREVLVRTVAAGLCHSDLHFMEGKYVPQLPWVGGHESAGVVEAVGHDVDYVEAGDHVVTCLS